MSSQTKNKHYLEDDASESLKLSSNETELAKEKRNSIDKSNLGPTKKIRLGESEQLNLPESRNELVEEESSSVYSDEDEYNYTEPENLEEEVLNEMDSDTKPYEQMEIKNNETNHLEKDNSIFITPNRLESKSIKINAIRSTKNSNAESNSKPSKSSRMKSSGLDSMIKIDKIREPPIPANIDEYGKCLKTPSGRYKYGLTLTDPYSQFFQGVLKGASGQTLAVTFGDINLISKLDSIPKEELGHFVMDTSYNVKSSSTVGVNHIFTINLLLRNQSIPVWFAITSCSSPELYKRIIIEFHQHVLDWPFTSVLLNDDPDLCQGVLHVFPEIDYYGSWFYYCHSIWNEIVVNGLVEECKANPTMMLAVKMLMAVPYLPPDSDFPPPLTMAGGFEVVRQFAEDNNFPAKFQNVLDYIVTFWFNTVETSNFTVHGKHTRAINYVEVFQLALLSFIIGKGNVWTITKSFQRVARAAESDVTRFINGKPFLAKKNKAKRYNVPIRDNMKKLKSGELSLEEFLKKSSTYCEEILDIFLHPLYACKVDEKHRYSHVVGWKIMIK